MRRRGRGEIGKYEKENKLERKIGAKKKGRSKERKEKRNTV